MVGEGLRLADGLRPQKTAVTGRGAGVLTRLGGGNRCGFPGVLWQDIPQAFTHMHNLAVSGWWTSAPKYRLEDILQIIFHDKKTGNDEWRIRSTVATADSGILGSS